jgi:hypothetical protein
MAWDSLWWCAETPASASPRCWTRWRSGRAQDTCCACAGRRRSPRWHFSGLSELAQPLLANLAALPAHQADALRSVLALSDGGGHGALAVFVAVTALLASGAESLPRLSGEVRRRGADALVVSLGLDAATADRLAVSKS